MLDFINAQKPLIETELRRFLEERKLPFEQVSPWGADLVQRLLSFMENGKMLRGALVQLASCNADGDPHPEAVKPAAAMELLQAFLLIHDDIMDQDTERRGKPSIFHQYASLGAQEGFSYAERFGQSMGICAGDIAMLLSTELLTETEVEASRRTELVRLATREIGYVGLAQMSDLANGHAKAEVGEERITGVYRYKTARYTFSLPLMLGATVVGYDDPTVHLLAKIGEELGIIFQMKDDDLGLFGDSEVMGKPVGSDIAEDKKTMHREYLFRSATPAERDRLNGIFGTSAVSEEDLRYVHGLLEHYDIRREVLSLMETYRAETASLIGELEGVPSTLRDGLTELLDYNLNRTR